MKPAKLVSSKKLSSPAGARDVSFGKADPDRRQQRDFSKSGIEQGDANSFDDFKDRQSRWNKKYGL